MHAVTIRNLPDATHRALKQQAMLHGKSTEAEIRAILEEAVRPKEEEVGLGTLLHEFAMQFGGLEIDLEAVRAMTPSEPPVSFE